MENPHERIVHMRINNAKKFFPIRCESAHLIRKILECNSVDYEIKEVEN